MHAIGLVLVGPLSRFGLMLGPVSCFGLMLWPMSCFGLMLWPMSCFGTLLGRPPGFFGARDRRAAALMARVARLAMWLAFG